MLLLAHITLAVLSTVLATLTIFQPSKTKYTSSYTLIVSTILSGGILAVMNPESLGRVCVSGLAYLGFVLFFRQKTLKRLEI